MTTRGCRLFLAFILSFLRPKISITDTSTLYFRVWPFDADFKYMNNSSFWTIAETGIMDLYFRSGAFKICKKNQWVPLMTSQKMVYRRPLKRFEKFQLKTKIIYWDGRTIYFNDIFLKNGQLIANCLIGAVCMGKNGRITPQRFMTALGVSSSLPYINVIESSNIIDRYLLNKSETLDSFHNTVKKEQ